jgi:hypothetical protein
MANRHDSDGRKALADNHHSKTLMEFGEALEETA